MTIKKNFLLSLIVFLVVIIFVTTISNAEKFEASLTETTYSGVTIKITTDQKINTLKIYKKAKNGKFILIAKNNANGASEVNVKIARTHLSTEEKTEIIIVTYDENENVIDFAKGEIDKLPQPASMNPEETAKPSWSPSTVPTYASPSAQPSKQSEPESSNNSNSSESSEVTKVKLNRTIVNMEIGKSVTLKATITPSNAKTTLQWSSSDSNVAEVDNNGKVTAKNSGIATITVKTENGKKDTCGIVVKSEKSNSSSSNSSSNEDKSSKMISKIPYINQTKGVYNKETKQYEHTDWPFKQLGSTIVYLYGCLLSSSQMSLSYLEGDLITIDSGNRSMYATGGGAAHWDMLKSVKNLGYKYTFINSKEEVDNALKNGTPVIAHLKGSLNGMDYSNPQHFVLIIGKIAENEYAISDPYSESNSYIITKKTFTWNEINSIVVGPDYSGAGYPDMKYIVISK